MTFVLLSIPTSTLTQNNPNEMLYKRIIKNLLYNFFYYLEYFFYQKQKAHQNLSDKKGSDYYMNTIFLIENPKEALKKQIVKNR